MKPKADVVVEIDARDVTPALFAALQPTWIRASGLVLPLVAMVGTYRLAGGGGDAVTTASVVAIAVAIAVRVARHLVASRALRAALARRERVSLAADALVRDGIRIAWDEVTDAAEIDAPHPEREAIRALALRAQGTWSVLTPIARFERGDYDGARAIVSAARHVRVVTV